MEMSLGGHTLIEAWKKSNVAEGTVWISFNFSVGRAPSVLERIRRPRPHLRVDSTFAGGGARAHSDESSLDLN